MLGSFRRCPAQGGSDVLCIEEGAGMRAVIEVLRSVALWLATGGVGMKPFIVQVMPPDDSLAERTREELPERRATPRSAA